jgi:hypothetical protein
VAGPVGGIRGDLVALARGRPFRYPRKGVTVATSDIWAYRDRTWTTGDLSGYGVEAVDGGIGKIDEVSNEVGAGYIVVDTGPWIFGKKVLLPAGVISRVDRDDEQVLVNRTKDQIKNAPEFDESDYRDDAYRSSLGSYYDQGGPGWRDW